jgi:hypothetical protein
MQNVVGLLYNLPLLVLELGIRRFFEKETHLGSSELSSFSSPARVSDTFVFKRSHAGAGYNRTRL